MEFCSCRKKFAAPGRLPVVEQDQPETAEAPVDQFAADLTALPGVVSVFWQGAERVVHVERTALASVMQVLRDDVRFAFQQCMDVCGVDWPQRGERFDVVYQLLSLTRNDRLRVITTTDESQPVPSVSAIWPGAAWWEREVWDLFGVLISGG